MERRHFLIGTGTVLSTIVAGCTEDSEEVDGGTRDDNGDETDEPEDDNGDGGSGESDETDESEDDEDDEDIGEADLEIVDHELVVEEGDFTTDVFVEVTVDNTGDAPSGDVELQVDWYDADGNYLDNDTGRLTTLGAGETWSARVYHLGTAAEDIDDYEIEGEFAEEAYEPPEGISLVESSMEVIEGDYDDELVVEGLVENDSGEDQPYVEVVATIYNANGVVLGDEWTNVTDLRDGDTWAFEFDYFSPDVRNRTDEAADHDILIKTSRW